MYNFQHYLASNRMMIGNDELVKYLDTAHLKILSQNIPEELRKTRKPHNENPKSHIVNLFSLVILNHFKSLPYFVFHLGNHILVQ
jgi:hypothetical protein